MNREELEVTVRGWGSKFWGWVTTNFNQPEQWAMGLVIVVSTWHVGLHLKHVEMFWLIAAIMGCVLGFLNGLFSYRLFQNQAETKTPALVGLVLSAGFRYMTMDTR